jgi:hypothetical protein
MMWAPASAAMFTTARPKADVDCASIGQNLVFLRGFSENSFASLITRTRARRARARRRARSA